MTLRTAAIILFAAVVPALALPAFAADTPAGPPGGGRGFSTATEEKPVIVTDMSTMPAGHWDVSGAHSQVVFSALHDFISPYYGRFEKVTGSMELDPKNPEKSTVSVQMPMTSFSTPFSNGTGKRSLDENLCKPKALDCEQFTSVAFQSTAIKKTGKNTGDITGNLTLHGVTKPVVLHATFIGEVPGPGGRKVMGFSANGMLKRSDFDITHDYWNLAVSDEVNFMVEAEFTKMAE
jgi:polyisoprenoid-binding protein YceI